MTAITRSRLVYWVLALLSLTTSIACRERKASVNNLQSAPAGESKVDFYRAGNRVHSPGADAYLDSIQPILAKRCVACHACNEAPCQLKLDSFQGLARGASPVDPYATRVGAIRPTYNESQFNSEQWRMHGFAAVLPNQGEGSSILLSALEAGTSNTPGFSLQPTAATTANSCPATNESYDNFIAAKPGLGMPFGLPAIPDAELGTLRAWLASGAPGPSQDVAEALRRPVNPKPIDDWEAFLLNGDGTGGPQVELVGRYIYEHSYLAQIYFDDDPYEYFNLVRSRTPPGQAIEEVFTELPYDNPGYAGRIYYRFKKIDKVIVRKNNIVWHLNDARLSFYKDLFFKRQTWWSSSTKVPGYADWNPFANFEQIPAKLRYQFLLDNKTMIIDFMTRGPVCVGSMATYVVADHFWGWALDPDSDPSVADPKLGQPDWSFLGVKDNAHTKIYLRAWENALQKMLKKKGKNGLGVDDIWDGKSGSPYANPSAFSTMLRHETNMTVHDGLAGGAPQSVWVVSFTHFERLYYDLVASFRAYGELTHKLNTWQYMTFIRQEGEDLYISLLPPAKRQAVRDRYTHGRAGYWKQFFDGNRSLYEDALVKVGIIESNMLSKSRGVPVELSEEDLAKAVIRRMGPEVVSQAGDVINGFYTAQAPRMPDRIDTQADMDAALGFIAQNRPKGRANSYFPNVSYLRVQAGGGESWLYTIVADRGYDSHNMAFVEQLVRDPDDDAIGFYRGIVGNYPNIFLDVKAGELRQVLADIAAVKDEVTWNHLAQRYGIARNDGKFWPFVDWLTSWQEANDQVNGGIIDLRLYGREQVPLSGVAQQEAGIRRALAFDGSRAYSHARFAGCSCIDDTRSMWNRASTNLERCRGCCEQYAQRPNSTSLPKSAVAWDTQCRMACNMSYSDGVFTSYTDARTCADVKSLSAAMPRRKVYRFIDLTDKADSSPRAKQVPVWRGRMVDALGLIQDHFSKISSCGGAADGEALNLSKMECCVNSLGGDLAQACKLFTDYRGDDGVPYYMRLLDTAERGGAPDDIVGRGDVDAFKDEVTRFIDESEY